jgi:hypothetical protein
MSYPTSLEPGMTNAEGSADANSKRDAIANTLDRAGAKLHTAADTLPGGERVAEIAHGAADKLEASGQYLHEHGAKEMMDDLEKLVRAHPGKSLLAVALLGVLVGRAFRNG